MFGFRVVRASRPAPPETPTSAPVAKDARTPLNWNVYALAAAGPAVMVLLTYILVTELRPNAWCSALIAASKIADIPTPQCTVVLLSLLEIYKLNTVMLCGTLAIVVIALGLAATGMVLRGHVAGNSLDIGPAGTREDPTHAVIDNTPTEPVPTAPIPPEPTETA